MEVNGLTPKEKVDEIIEKVANIENNNNDFTTDVKMALIVIDEILSFIEDDRNGFNWKDYYKEVRKEIWKTL